MPVDDNEEAEELSSSRLSGVPVGSVIGASGGNMANLDLAKDFWSSLIGGGARGRPEEVNTDSGLCTTNQPRNAVEVELVT